MREAYGLLLSPLTTDEDRHTYRNQRARPQGHLPVRQEVDCNSASNNLLDIRSDNGDFHHNPSGLRDEGVVRTPSETGIATRGRISLLESTWHGSIAQDGGR